MDEVEPPPSASYRILESLAAGGMGQVDLAERSIVGAAPEIVVIKRLVPALVEREDYRRLLIEEARVLAHLHHPNVVRLIESGWARDRFFVIMEYVHGHSLSALLARLARLGRRLPLEVAVFVVAEIARALEYVHGACDESGVPLRMIHRDVAPANVLLSSDGGVKLTDFGIAKTATSRLATHPGIIKGKSGYMSPEQAAGFPVDETTDVFSLGVLLWEATLSRRLYVRDSAGSMAPSVQRGDAPRPRELDPDYPPELELLVLSALQRERGARASAAALRAGLDELLSRWRADTVRDRLGELVAEELREHPARAAFRLDPHPSVVRPRPTAMHVQRGLTAADTESVTAVQVAPATLVDEVATTPAPAPAHVAAPDPPRPASAPPRAGVESTGRVPRPLLRRPRTLAAALSLGVLGVLLAAAVPRGHDRAPPVTALRALAGTPLPSPPPPPTAAPPSSLELATGAAAAPAPRPRADAELRVVAVDAIDPGVTIRVDGRRVPCRRRARGDLLCPVPPGRHEVTLEWSPGQIISEEVAVSIGERTTCRLADRPLRLRCDDGS